MELFDNLTEKQLAVYEFIRDKIRNRGYGPTVREIGSNFDQLTQRGGVSLEGPGEEGHHHPRAEHVAGDPVGGRADRGPQPAAVRAIAAGVLHEAVEQDERVDFESLFDPADKYLFVLEVTANR